MIEVCLKENTIRLRDRAAKVAPIEAEFLSILANRSGFVPKAEIVRRLYGKCAKDRSPCAIRVIAYRCRKKVAPISIVIDGDKFGSYSMRPASERRDIVSFCLGCNRAKKAEEFPLGTTQGHCRECHYASRLRLSQSQGISYGKRRPWGPLDDARLMALYVIGIESPEIADIIERADNTVYVRLRNLRSKHPEIHGLSSPRHQPWTANTPDLIAEVIRLRQVHSNAQVAKQLGITTGKVAGLYWRHNGKAA